MRNKTTVINTIPPSADYPMGRIKNDTGVNDGTPIVEENNGDVMETVTYFMERAKITPNGLPDNVSNGYQIANAIKKTAGKFDTVHSSIIDAQDRFEVDFRLDNVYNNQYFIVKFNAFQSAGTQTVLGVNQIIDSEGNIYNAFLSPDFLGNFFNDGRYIVQKENDYFLVYPIASRSVLHNIYERLESLEINNSRNMRIIDSGVYIDSESRNSGVIVIPHEVINIANTKIIFTCSRANPDTSLVSTTFTSLIIDRSINQFRVAFSNFPVGNNADKLKIEWFVVNG